MWLCDQMHTITISLHNCVTLASFFEDRIKTSGLFYPAITLKAFSLNKLGSPCPSNDFKCICIALYIQHKSLEIFFIVFEMGIEWCVLFSLALFTFSTIAIVFSVVCVASLAESLMLSSVERYESTAAFSRNGSRPLCDDLRNSEEKITRASPTVHQNKLKRARL